jgi:murein DD-endopeptidase MepM/ murein hydrolase activator NlpD
MSTAERAIVQRWTAKLVSRKALLVAARARLRARETPTNLRTVKLRKKQVAEAERVLARHTSGTHVCSPIEPISTMANGFSGGHDGVDIMSGYDDDVCAMFDGIVRDARSGGWWGKGAKPTHGHPVSDGDGIIQIECTRSVGPFKAGMIFGYGHTEKHRFKAGQYVKAGQVIAKNGWANGAHIHMMGRNAHPGPKTQANRPSGIGQFDPRPFIDYARSHD